MFSITIILYSTNKINSTSYINFLFFFVHHIQTRPEPNGSGRFIFFFPLFYAWAGLSFSSMFHLRSMGVLPPQQLGCASGDLWLTFSFLTSSRIFSTISSFLSLMKISSFCIGLTLSLSQNAGYNQCYFEKMAKSVLKIAKTEAEKQFRSLWEGKYLIFSHRLCKTAQ